MPGDNGAIEEGITGGLEADKELLDLEKSWSKSRSRETELSEPVYLILTKGELNEYKNRNNCEKIFYCSIVENATL